MLASDTAGTPLGKRIVKVASFVPGDMSLTVPDNTMLSPNLTPLLGAESVVALGPLPIA